MDNQDIEKRNADLRKEIAELDTELRRVLAESNEKLKGKRKTKRVEWGDGDPRSNTEILQSLLRLAIESNAAHGAILRDLADIRNFDESMK